MDKKVKINYIRNCLKNESTNEESRQSVKFKKIIAFKDLESKFLILFTVM